MRKVLAAVLAAGALVACSGEEQPAAPTASAKATQPEQQETGYGGSDYTHASMRRTEVDTNPGAVTIFEPAGPVPQGAPVVVQAQIGSPEGYLGWIEHVVRRGSILVYLDAPLTGSTDAERIGGPVRAYAAAVRELAKPGHVRPRWDRTTFVGHSIGGVIVSRIAAVAPTKPKAILAVQPPVAAPQDTAPLKAVPATIRLVVVASDQDDRVGTEGAKDLWRALGQLRDRRYVFVRSDDHGEPALEASHLFPLSGPGNDPDALDHLGIWPVLDAVQDCVATGRGCDLPAVEAQWSDGTAIVTQEVRNAP